MEIGRLGGMGNAAKRPEPAIRPKAADDFEHIRKLRDEIREREQKAREAE